IVARVLTVKRASEELPDQEGARFVLKIENIDAKPSLFGKKAEIRLSLRRIRKTVAQLILPGVSCNGQRITNAGLQFAGLAEALDSRFAGKFALQTARFPSCLPPGLS